MATVTKLDSELGVLTDLVRSDIQARRLRPGDRYFTAEEAGRRFGVPRAVMNKAMRVLSDSEVLVRRQKAGTFIGPCAETVSASSKRTPLTKIFVLTTHSVAGTYVDADDMIEVFWREFPGASVEFIRLPSDSPVEYVRDLIDRAGANGESVGFLPISIPRKIYTLLAGSQLPVVVMGSLGIEVAASLSSVDGDYVAAGRMLVEYLIAQGRQRISVLMPEVWLQGDNLFFESIRQTMGEAGLPVTSLCVRSLPSDQSEFAENVRLLLQQEDRPTAIISRKGLMRRGKNASHDVWAPALIAEIASSVGLSVPDDLIVAYDLGRNLPEKPLPFPCTHRFESWSQTLEKVAQMLHEVASQGPGKSAKQVLLPVALYVPDAA